MEEGGDHTVADQARDFQFRIGRLQQRTQFGLGRPIGMVTDLRATFFCRFQVIAYELAEQR